MDLSPRRPQTRIRTPDPVNRHLERNRTGGTALSVSQAPQNQTFRKNEAPAIYAAIGASVLADSEETAVVLSGAPPATTRSTKLLTHRCGSPGEIRVFDFLNLAKPKCLRSCFDNRTIVWLCVLGPRTEDTTRNAR